MEERYSGGGWKGAATCSCIHALSTILLGEGLSVKYCRENNTETNEKNGGPGRRRRKRRESFEEYTERKIRGLRVEGRTRGEEEALDTQVSTTRSYFLNKHREGLAVCIYAPVPFGDRSVSRIRISARTRIGGCE